MISSTPPGRPVTNPLIMARPRTAQRRKPASHPLPGLRLPAAVSLALTLTLTLTTMVQATGLPTGPGPHPGSASPAMMIAEAHAAPARQAVSGREGGRVAGREAVSDPGAMAEAERAALLSRIETYLNDITTLSADFVQVGPDGSIAHGTFALKRPGRLRIAYAPPTPLLIVSSGFWLTFYDSELEQATYARIEETLAGFLVRETISLTADDIIVTDLERAHGVVRISITRKADPEGGTLSLIFNDSPLQLRQWEIADATGALTRVALISPEFGHPIADSLFRFTPPRPGFEADDSP